MRTRKKAWFLAAATLTAACGIGTGCSTESNDSISQSGDEAALRALSAQELVGKLACGESKRVHHSGDPTYRGLQIDAPASTTLSITVTMPEGTPRLWLQSTTAATLAKAVPSNGAPALMTYTTTAAKKLVLAMREANYEGDADFDVTLTCSGNTVVDAGTDATPTEAGGPVPVSGGRVLLFGGLDSNGRLANTWEWNGSSWTQRTTANGPSARSGHEMAYDSARQKVVLFGGYGSNWLADTWEWDGSSWTRRSTAIGPSARLDHAMAYDSARQKVVLFGGYNSRGANFADTWEWDGSSWTQLTISNGPSARRSHAMAYDSARQKVVLFGGRDGSGRLADTWEWDGSSWTQLTSANGPSARQEHAMAYDSARQKVVLFGGYDSSSRADTWEWNGSSWTERTTSNGPSARYSHAMAYDSARQKVVLFGGDWIQLGIAADTWEWDGSSWTQRTSANGPSARVDHAMVGM